MSQSLLTAQEFYRERLFSKRYEREAMKARNFATGFMNMGSTLPEFDFYSYTVFLHLTCSVVVQMTMYHAKVSLILA